VLKTQICVTRPQCVKEGDKTANIVLHDFAEAYFTSSICTHKCHLIYALKKNIGFFVLMFTELTNIRTGSRAGLNRFMCRIEQVHVQV